MVGTTDDARPRPVGSAAPPRVPAPRRAPGDVPPGDPARARELSLRLPETAVHPTATPPAASARGAAGPAPTPTAPAPREAPVRRALGSSRVQIGLGLALVTGLAAAGVALASHDLRPTSTPSAAHAPAGPPAPGASAALAQPPAPPPGPPPTGGPAA